MLTSRIGRKPIDIPAGVEVKVEGQKIQVKGPKGSLSLNVHPFAEVSIESNQVKVQLNKNSIKGITGAGRRLYRSIAGTLRANIYNVIFGVSTGFERRLSLVGVGYRAQAKGKIVSLNLGFSHPTDFEVPEGVTIETPTQTEIVIKGTSKQQVGLVAAKIRSIRGPEPYKGKGIRYSNEIIELKETKKK